MRLFRFFCRIMKYTSEFKQNIKSLYTKGDRTQKEIAQMFSLPISTLSSWIKREGWDIERASLAVSIDTIIPKILSKIDRELEDDKLTADSLAKYCKQLRELNRSTLNINDYYQVMTKFIDFLRLHAATNDNITPKLLQVVIKAQDEFIKSLAL